MEKKDNNLVDQVLFHLQNNFNVSADESKNILKTIALTLRKNISDLRRACEEDDLPEMARHLHSIKGALLNLGQIELAQTTESLEIAARAREKHDYFFSIQKIENMLQPLIN